MWTAQPGHQAVPRYRGPSDPGLRCAPLPGVCVNRAFFATVLLHTGLAAVGCTSKAADSGSSAWVGEPFDSGIPAQTVRVGTFNIEWLTADPNDGDMRRNDVDHAMIVDLIDSFDPDVLALQEVEGDTALAHLPLDDHWSWSIGSTGWSQNVAILWRSDRVSVTNIREITLPHTDGAEKEPHVVEVSAGGFDFTFVGVHHAAFSDSESSRERAYQASELVDWLSDTLPDTVSGTAADHIVVAGDYNDTFGGINSAYPSLEAFTDAGFTFATSGAAMGTQLSYDSVIDHVALSPAMADRWSEADGCHIEAHDQTSPWSDYEGGYRSTQNISDHRPVWIDLVTTSTESAR